MMLGLFAVLAETLGAQSVCCAQYVCSLPTAVFPDPNYSS